MKPPPFAYGAPATKLDIVGALAEAPAGARILAGGQSLVPLLNGRNARPSAVIDINRAVDLGRIAAADGRLYLGALVRMADAERSTEVRAACPLITEALRWVANPQVRNRATVVGNLVHAGRGSELPAVALALEAEFVIESATSGVRRCCASGFFRTDGTVDCGPREFVSAVIFPVQPAGSGSAFLEVQRRSAHYALIGVAAVLLIVDGRISEARVALAGAAPFPVRCHLAERELAGARGGPELYSRAALTAASEGTEFAYDDVHATADYRRAVAPELVARALAEAARAAEPKRN
jgi:carbon-monoxide dehydrogenase medium subunit